jgi:hypothetical protein
LEWHIDARIIDLDETERRLRDRRKSTSGELFAVERLERTDGSERMARGSHVIHAPDAAVSFSMTQKCLI